jgi:hypothetical protein
VVGDGGRLSGADLRQVRARVPEQGAQRVGLRARQLRRVGGDLRDSFGEALLLDEAARVGGRSYRHHFLHVDAPEEVAGIAIESTRDRPRLRPFGT